MCAQCARYADQRDRHMKMAAIAIEGETWARSQHAAALERIETLEADNNVLMSQNGALRVDRDRAISLLRRLRSRSRVPRRRRPIG